MSTAFFNIMGIILSLVGVVLMFHFAIPYRIRTGGASYEVREEIDENARRKEKIYDIFGWLGLLLIIIGGLCQVWGTLVQ